MTDQQRRTRQAGAGALALAVVLGGAAIWTSTRHDSRLTVAGTGDTACHTLIRRLGAGSVADHRLVDGPTAARWLSKISTDVDPSTYRDERQVTVCVVNRRTSWSTYVVGGGRVERVTAGDYGRGPHNLVSAMAALDDLSTGVSLATKAPFRCPSDSSAPAHDVSSSLPSGATGALLCYRDDTLYSPRRILDPPGVDALVLAIDRAPMTYVLPDMNCGGVADFREYSIVFRYPTGTRAVSMEVCRGLAIGSYTRELPRDLDLRFERLLLEGGGVTTGEPLACPPPSADAPRGVGDLRHLTRARWCPAGGGPGQVLTGSDLATLVSRGHDLRPGSTGPDTPCSVPAQGWPQLVLEDAWGNRFTASVECPQHFLAVRSDGGHPPTYYAAIMGAMKPWQAIFRHLRATSP
jgi:hypothetical protein